MWLKNYAMDIHPLEHHRIVFYLVYHWKHANLPSLVYETLHQIQFIINDLLYNEFAKNILFKMISRKVALSLTNIKLIVSRHYLTIKTTVLDVFYLILRWQVRIRKKTQLPMIYLPSCRHGWKSKTIHIIGFFLK